MDRDTFWSIVDNARKTVDDTYDVAPAVTEKLKELTSDEIVSFKQHQYQLLDESYRWDLWAVGYIVNGGCSDDGFDYFRAWLMANGSERWETALENPEASSSGGRFVIGRIDRMTMRVRDKYHVWHLERIWEATRDLPVFDVDIESLKHLDAVCWFDNGFKATRLDHFKFIRSYKQCLQHFGQPDRVRTDEAYGDLMGYDNYYYGSRKLVKWDSYRNRVSLINLGTYPGNDREAVPSS